MNQQQSVDPKKLAEREKFVGEITARQNHLYLRARFVEGTQKQRKQSKTN